MSTIATGYVKEYKQFKEFSAKDRDKLAEIIEKNTDDLYLSKAVEGYIYATTRALDFGDFYGTLDRRALWEHAINKNADLFNYDELMDIHPTRKIERYLTFRSAGIFLNHNSKDPEGAIGLAFDSTMITEPYDDMHVVLLFGVDKVRSPNVARTLQTYPQRVGTSMGCSIYSSTCTACGKEIHNDSDFCDCLRHHRGGRHKGKVAAELLKVKEFYEQSVVTVPACETAFVIDAISEILPGRMLKVASELPEAESKLRIIGSLYDAIKQATTIQDKKRLSNQMDSVISKLEKAIYG